MKILIVDSWFKVLVVVLTTVLLSTLACSDGSGSKTSKSLKSNSNSIMKSSMKIQYPTGSLLPASVLKSKVPTFFNLSELTNNVYGMLLGPSLPTNKEYDCEPIGVYTLVRDSVELSFILCKSDQLDDKLIDADNYNSWSLNEIQYKNLIASWFKTNCELNNCSEMEWANDLKALRILEKVK